MKVGRHGMVDWLHAWLAAGMVVCMAVTACAAPGPDSGKQAGEPALLEDRRSGVILTPHPGEMARLIGGSAAAVERDRFGAARQAVERFGAVIVLKGAGTIVADQTLLTVTLTGNPGMATGGMGDVLAGLMTGLAAQGLSPFDAASSAVFLHGCAGDDVARSGSQAGVTAMAVADAIPRVFRRVQVR